MRKCGPLILTGIFFASFFSLMPFCSAANNPEDGITTIDGQLADVDWVGSTISVKWFSTGDDQPRETIFSVGPEVKIIRGTQEADFSDLNRGDTITLTYTKDDSGGNKLLSVTVVV